jgi:histidyl-tRNA synthetase
VVAVGERAQRQGLLLSERLRDALPALRILTHCGGGSFKSQFKKADRSGARYALVLGDDEVDRREVGVKALREERDQQTVAFDALDSVIAGLLGWD